MKCAACGYEYKSEFVIENGTYFHKPIIGDEKFILINGSYTINIENDYFNEIKEIYCPINVFLAISPLSSPPLA